MRILVVGAGEVGSYIAERLSREGNDVIVVDQHSDRLDALGAEFDLLTVHGSGTNPGVLAEAGLDRAEVVVAVTDSDEVNLLACMQAKQRGVPATVARLQDSDLRGTAGRSLRNAIGVDLVLDPDEQTADAIMDLLVYHGVSDINELANGEVHVIGARLAEDAPLVGKTMAEVGAYYEPEWDFIFGVLSRDGEVNVMRRETTLQPHDLLRVVCRRQGRRELMEIMGLSRSDLRRVMILGGGRTAGLLAGRLLERHIDVVIIELLHERCLELSERYAGALVLHGDITDIDVLAREDIGSFDAVVAVTGEDDANVLACLYAKSEGASETIAVVHRLSLLPLLEQVGIDAALSPRTASANMVLRMVRGGVTAVATFLEGNVEVLEFAVSAGSRADGSLVRDLHLPGQMLLAAIVRDGKARIARGRSELRARDHVVAFVTPDCVDEVKQAFR
ncbi:Trk system potassium transporter TrkA [Candidatus Poriferisodalis sp.]|uniref:Trk system potassium transporter TrkA n=1 Tax=Candidatus Poriferisodalis sp. TaxID=3101277 RepID=UPI003C6EEC76